MLSNSTRRNRGPRKGSTAKRLFGPLAEAGALAYLRERDLPKLIALWPREIGDQTEKGCRLVLAKLRSALRAERQRARSGHWSYDLNRHLALLGAYKGELAGLGKRLRSAELDPSRQRLRRRVDAGVE